MAATAQGGEALGGYIAKRRLALGLTKAEAARRAGVARRTWHEVEEGTPGRNVSALTLTHFDKALELPEGTLWAMTARSADQAVEALRRRAMALVSLMTTDELEEFVASEGAHTIQSQLRALRDDISALRRDRRLPADPVATPSSGRRPG